MILVEKVGDWSMILQWKPFHLEQHRRGFLIDNFFCDFLWEIFVDVSVLHSGLFVKYFHVVHLFSHVIIFFLIKVGYFGSCDLLSLGYTVLSQFDHTCRTGQVLVFYILWCWIRTMILFSRFWEAGSLGSRPNKIVVIVHLVENSIPLTKIILSL